VAGQFARYLGDQVRFIRAVEKMVPVRVRLDPAEFGWQVDQFLSDAGFGDVIERTTTPLMRRLSGCRLAVSTYNATVFLETLACNFPTLVFFDPTLFEIRPDAAPMMDALRQAGVLHDSPESAASFVVSRGGMLQNWWQSRHIQSVRRAFCARYAHAAGDWADEWARKLRELSNRGIAPDSSTAIAQ
jgi:putative transferase (TIGR04331 family)